MMIWNQKTLRTFFKVKDCEPEAGTTAEDLEENNRGEPSEHLSLQEKHILEQIERIINTRTQDPLLCV